MIQGLPPKTGSSRSDPSSGATGCGVFIERLIARDVSGQRALFLDRDGVIVEETNYLHRLEDVRMIPGVAEAIAAVNRMEIPVVIVTNQAGIGRGYYDWSAFHDVQRHICEELARIGAHLDMIVACAYHRDGLGEYAFDDHPWRKPRPGMLLEAEAQLGVDLASSHIVGDCLSDIQAGAEAGLRSGALVETGHGQREWQRDGAQAFEALEREMGFKSGLFPSACAAIYNWLISLR